MGDFIKIDRKILNWEWWSDLNTFRLFMYMLISANWKDGNFKGILIPRGSFVSSISKLASETCLSEREVRTAIKHLKLTGELTVKTTNKYSVFTINNYCLYQDTDMQNVSQVTGNRQASDMQNVSQVTTIEEIKNKEIKNNINTVSNDTVSSEHKNASEPPVIELLLNDKSLYPIYQNDIDEWKELYPAVNIMQELRNMKGWLYSNPRRRKTKGGIKRFVTTWLSKSQDRAPKPREEVNTYESESTVQLW
jgi:hypothetical protein